MASTDGEGLAQDTGRDRRGRDFRTLWFLFGVVRRLGCRVERDEGVHDPKDHRGHALGSRRAPEGPTSEGSALRIGGRLHRLDRSVPLENPKADGGVGDWISELVSHPDPDRLREGFARGGCLSVAGDGGDRHGRAWKSLYPEEGGGFTETGESRFNHDLSGLGGEPEHGFGQPPLPRPDHLCLQGPSPINEPKENVGVGKRATVRP
jgi:hypothetical protein